MPKAVAKAVNTVMVIFRILPQMVLFSFSMVIVFLFQRRDTEAQRTNYFEKAERTEFSPCLMNHLKEGLSSQRLCVVFYLLFFFRSFFTLLLRVLDVHLAVVQLGEGIGEHQAGTEVDA